MTVLEETTRSIDPSDEDCRERARQRLDQLVMPHWALGRLMDLAEELAGMTRSTAPPVDRRTVVVMAADHGVAAEGVSKFPQEVTCQMVGNFARGKAAINALSACAEARVQVVDMGVACDPGAFSELQNVLSRRVAAGTANMTREPAMSREQARASVEAGIEVARELAGETDVFGTGDMGIGNTTPSAAVAAVLTGSDPADVTGRGTGIDDQRLKNKIRVVETALEVNRPNPDDALDVLAKVGGFEIGGLAGLILGAAECHKPVVIDGFICTAAALIAHGIAPAAADYMVAAHRSQESGHALMQEQLGKVPLLDLDMRLGEGSGAALAMKLVEAAARLLTDVSTFEEASTSGAAE